MTDDFTPEPYRSPLDWYKPTIIGTPRDFSEGRAAAVQVSFPNEDPDTEDDLTLNFAFTEEGIIIDLFVSDGEPVATFGQTYEEFVGTLHDLDPALHRMAEKVNADVLDPTVGKVAALSADLRMLVESDDDYVDDAQTMMCATDLLDAIEAMLSEMGR